MPSMTVPPFEVALILDVHGDSGVKRFGRTILKGRETRMPAQQAGVRRSGV
jgi:hypothetical protein